MNIRAMSSVHASELFQELGGVKNSRLWQLHIAEAYRVGRENIQIEVAELFSHCLNVAYDQWMAEQAENLPLDDLEYMDILKAQEIYNAL